jgi:translation initiation factor 5B
MDEYVTWMESEREAKARREFDELVKPGKIEVMEGFIFRRARPAIFGVKVIKGFIATTVSMINLEGDRVGIITQIQDSGEAIPIAEEGEEVAVSMPQPIVGRHIKERDVLLVDVPEKQAKLLQEKYLGRLTIGAMEALQELIKIKRMNDLLWAV